MPTRVTVASSRRLSVSLVVATAAALWLGLAAWAFSSPVGSAPDDDFHLANIYCAAGAATCVEEGTRVKPCYAHEPTIPGACHREGNATLPRTTGHVPDYYPPLYSNSMGLLIGDTVADSVRNVRLANVTLTTLLVMGSVLLSRRALRVAVAAAWLSFAVPLAMFLTSSASPNAWSIIGLAALWGPAISFMTQDGRRTLGVIRVVFVAVAAVMALGARSEPPLFVGAFALALLIGSLPWPLRTLVESPAQHLKLLFPLGLGAAALATLTTFGGRKTAHSLFGEFEHAFTLSQAAVLALISPLAGLGYPELPANKLGWSDTAMPWVVPALSIAAIVGLMVAGGRVWTARKIATIATFGTASFLVILFFWSIAWHNTRYPPRYFLPVFMVTMGLLLLPNLTKYGKIPGRNVLPVAAALLVLANAVALFTNTTRYVVGLTPDTMSSPTALAEGGTPWWWWSFFGLDPLAHWIFGSLAFAVAVALGVALVRGYTAPPKALTPLPPAVSMSHDARYRPQPPAPAGYPST